MSTQNADDARLTGCLFYIILLFLVAIVLGMLGVQIP